MTLHVYNARFTAHGRNFAATVFSDAEPIIGQEWKATICPLLSELESGGAIWEMRGPQNCIRSAGSIA